MLESIILNLTIVKQLRRLVKANPISLLSVAGGLWMLVIKPHHLQEKIMAGITKQSLIELQQQLDAADAVNRHLKVQLLQKKVESNEVTEVVTGEALKKQVTDKERHKEIKQMNATLRDRIGELKTEKEGILVDIKHLQDCNKEWKKTYGSMKDKLKQAVSLKDLYEGELKNVRKEAEEQVKDLNQHNSLLTGELRGANYCFTKLAEEMAKGKEVA